MTEAVDAIRRPPAHKRDILRVPKGTDLVEWYFEQGWTDGLPVVPPTPEKVDAAVAALGGEPDFVECRAPPLWQPDPRGLGDQPGDGRLQGRVRRCGARRAVGLDRARLQPQRRAGDDAYGGAAARRERAPRARDRHEWRRQRLRLGQPRQCHDRPRHPPRPLECRRRLAGRPRQIDPGHPGKYSYAVAENEAESPWAPYHVEKGFAAEDSTVFVIAAEPPHSVTNHVADDPEGVLDSICSAMRTIAHDDAVSSGHCAVAIGPEHARTIAAKGWSRHDVKSYLHMNGYNLFRGLAFDHRYGRVYNRNLPRWYKREPRVARPDRAQPRSHPSVRDRRRGRTVFRLHPGLGAYVIAGAARHRGRRCRRRFALRRRHVLFVSWRQANGQRKV